MTLSTPLLAAFEDPSVGIAGAWGVRSATGRAFEDAPPGEVDAIEGYCLAVRREVLRTAGLFDHHFRFYRNADLDFSFQARAAGWRAVAVAGLPLRRHEHRGYAALAPAERERLSKRNFYRFLKHWGDRRDLLLDSGHWTSRITTLRARVTMPEADPREPPHRVQSCVRCSARVASCSRTGWRSRSGVISGPGARSTIGARHELEHVRSGVGMG